MYRCLPYALGFNPSVPPYILNAKQSETSTCRRMGTTVSPSQLKLLDNFINPFKTPTQLYIPFRVKYLKAASDAKCQRTTQRLLIHSVDTHKTESKVAQRSIKRAAKAPSKQIEAFGRVRVLRIESRQMQRQLCVARSSRSSGRAVAAAASGAVPRAAGGATPALLLLFVNKRVRARGGRHVTPLLAPPLADAAAAATRAPVRRRHSPRIHARTLLRAARRHTRTTHAIANSSLPFCLFFACVLRTVLFSRQ